MEREVKLEIDNIVWVICRSIIEDQKKGQYLHVEGRQERETIMGTGGHVKEWGIS